MELQLKYYINDLFINEHCIEASATIHYENDNNITRAINYMKKHIDGVLFLTIEKSYQHYIGYRLMYEGGWFCENYELKNGHQSNFNGKKVSPAQVRKLVAELLKEEREIEACKFMEEE